MANPLVSVLIPTYARPHYLREALVSVLGQDFDDLEVIVGDDGTLGGAVVAQLSDPRVEYVQHPTRLGMANNWNYLLDRARGRYVALLMDDDRYLPGFLSACLDAFTKHPDVGVTFTNLMFARGQHTWARDRILRPGKYETFAREFVLTKPVPVSASLIAREAWLQVGPLPDTAAADMVLFGRIAGRGWPFYYLDRALMVYRLHSEQLSSTMGFPHDDVRAWESLEFADPDTERLRRMRLAEALLSVAAGQLRSGDIRKARTALARAERLTPSSWLRLRTLKAVSSTGPLAPILLRSGSRVAWRPWRRD